MHPSLRKLALSTTMAATFTLALVPAVLAGGVGAKLEGPARDGVTYTLQTFACSGDEMTGVSGASMISPTPTSGHHACQSIRWFGFIGSASRMSRSM